jgi:hypothetical protein
MKYVLSDCEYTTQRDKDTTLYLPPLFLSLSLLASLLPSLSLCACLPPSPFSLTHTHTHHTTPHITHYTKPNYTHPTHTHKENNGNRVYFTEQKFSKSPLAAHITRKRIFYFCERQRISCYKADSRKITCLALCLLVD